jgi:S-adenosylmethionine hydrolase
MPGTGTVALLTDFGAADVFVGVMKAVILSRAPRARLVDLTHEIAPRDVAAGALRLWQAAPFLPGGTVVLAVVDPGVGTSRRAVAVSAGALRCVGPDNGIFTYLLAREPRWSAVEIELPPPVSSTFHGRDIFAPAAGMLCAGARLPRLGRSVADLVRLPFPHVSVSVRGFQGEVLLADRFGNLVTSIGVLTAGNGFLAMDPWVPRASPARLDGRAFTALLPGGIEVPFARTFSDAPPGGAIAYIGSDGLLEIAVNGGRAADSLATGRGARITLVPSAAGR